MNSASAQEGSKLYSPRLLMLSASLADFPLDADFAHVASARSRACGSTIDVGLDTDASGATSRIGMQVTACAVGQSSAAILAKGAAGVSLAQFEDARAQITDWLDDDGPVPSWPDFDALDAAREHRGRHGALLLPWNAVIEALSSRASSS